MTHVQIRAVAWDDSVSQGGPLVHQMTPAHMKPTDSKIPLFVLKTICFTYSEEIRSFLYQ